MLNSRRSSGLALLLLLVALPYSAQAGLVVTWPITPLGPSGGGGTTLQIDLTVVTDPGSEFNPDDGWEIFFDPTIFDLDDLNGNTSLSSGDTDWAFTANGICAPLFYTDNSICAQRITSVSPTVNMFTLTLDTLDPYSGVIGPSTWEFVDFSNIIFESLNGFELLDTGLTQTPEPATSMLVLGGLVALGLWRRKRRRAT